MDENILYPEDYGVTHTMDERRCPNKERNGINWRKLPFDDENRDDDEELYDGFQGPHDQLLRKRASARSA